MIVLKGDFMSFLLQCTFYFINTVIDFIAGDYLSFDITDEIRFFLMCISIILTIIGFVAIFKTKGKTIRYLDIPLLFVTNLLYIVFDMYTPDFSGFSLVPNFFALIPGTFYMIRVIKWIVDVVKKRRKPEKKNAIIVVAYVLATSAIFVLSFVDFSADKQKPTEAEIQLINKCYDYNQRYLVSLPADDSELQNIASLTAKVTEDDFFIKCFDESEFYKNSNGGILRGVAKIKSMNRKRAYADIVGLRLKTLIALKEYNGYTEFFVDNCGYLFYADITYYFDLWANDNYELSGEDFDAIISGYTGALSLCDNDSDRLFIISDIIRFYEKYEPENTQCEKYKELRSEIYAVNEYEDLLEASRNSVGYTSEKLAVG